MHCRTHVIKLKGVGFPSVLITVFRIRGMFGVNDRRTDILFMIVNRI